MQLINDGWLVNFWEFTTQYILGAVKNLNLAISRFSNYIDLELEQRSQEGEYNQWMIFAMWSNECSISIFKRHVLVQSNNSLVSQPAQIQGTGIWIQFQCFWVCDKPTGKRAQRARKSMHRILCLAYRFCFADTPRCIVFFGITEIHRK